MIAPRPVSRGTDVRRQTVSIEETAKTSFHDPRWTVTESPWSSRAPRRRTRALEIIIDSPGRTEARNRESGSQVSCAATGFKGDS